MTDPYESLANAIVFRAADDYRKALQTLKRNRKNHKAKCMKEEVERFFRSPWYQELTGLDSAFLMQKIREEVGFDESQGDTETGVLSRQKNRKRHK